MIGARLRKNWLLRIATVCAVVVVVPTAGWAETGGFSLVEKGPSARCIDMVVVAEGYTKEQKQVFIANAKLAASKWLSFGPYKGVRELVNVDALWVESEESGADHPSKATYRKTAFDATFDTGGIQRLLTVDAGKVLAEVGKHFPNWDYLVVLVNDNTYGGSGGAVPVVSVHQKSTEILLHELGHNIGGLADEYEAPYPGYPPGDPEPNVALAKNLSPLKWAHWTYSSTPIPTPDSAMKGPHDPIGAYEGARYKSQGVYRPAPNCMMRSMDQAFCPVCFEALAIAMAKGVKAVAGGEPSGPVTCKRGDCPLLSVDASNIADLEGRWRVDGVVIQGEDGLDFDPNTRQSIDGEVEVEVFHGADYIWAPDGGWPMGKWSWQVKMAPNPALEDAGVSDDGNGHPDTDESDGAAVDDAPNGEGLVGADTDTGADTNTTGHRPADDGCTVGPGTPQRSFPVSWLAILVVALSVVLRRRRTITR